MQRVRWSYRIARWQVDTNRKNILLCLDVNPEHSWLGWKSSSKSEVQLWRHYVNIIFSSNPSYLSKATSLKINDNIWHTRKRKNHATTKKVSLFELPVINNNLFFPMFFERKNFQPVLFKDTSWWWLPLSDHSKKMLLVGNRTKPV